MKGRSIPLHVCTQKISRKYSLSEIDADITIRAINKILTCLLRMNIKIDLDDLFCVTYKNFHAKKVGENKAYIKGVLKREKKLYVYAQYLLTHKIKVVCKLLEKPTHAPNGLKIPYSRLKSSNSTPSLLPFKHKTKASEEQ